jgi:aldehyde dehydrogenase
MTVYAAPGSAGSIVEFRARYDHWIGGQYVKPTSGEYFENITPVTGKVFCEVCSEEKRNERCVVRRSVL